VIRRSAYGELAPRVNARATSAPVTHRPRDGDVSPSSQPGLGSRSSVQALASPLCGRAVAAALQVAAEPVRELVEEPHHCLDG
jgi:hypothetical protein